MERRCYHRVPSVAMATVIVLACVMCSVSPTLSAPTTYANFRNNGNDDSTGAAGVPPSSSSTAGIGRPVQSLAQHRKLQESDRLREIRRYILENIDRRLPTSSSSSSSIVDEAPAFFQPVSSLESLPASLTAILRGESFTLGLRSNDSTPVTSSERRQHHREHTNLEQRHPRPHRQRQDADNEDFSHQPPTETGSRRSIATQRKQHRHQQQQQQQQHGSTHKNAKQSQQSRRKEGRLTLGGTTMTTEIRSIAETVCSLYGTESFDYCAVNTVYREPYGDLHLLCPDPQLKIGHSFFKLVPGIWTMLNATEEGIVEFRLNGSELETLRPKGNGHRKSAMQVTTATVNVLLRPRSTKSNKRQANGVGVEVGRRLGIKIYALDRPPVSSENAGRTGTAANSRAYATPTQDQAPLETVDAAATTGPMPYDSAAVHPTSSSVTGRPHHPVSSMSLVAELQLTAPRRRRHAATWQTLLLPTTFVQDAIDARRSSPPVIRLQIVCDGCEAAGRELVVGGMASSTGSPFHVEADNSGRVTTERRRRGPPDAAAAAESSATADVPSVMGSRGSRGRSADAEATSTAPYLVVQVKQRQNNSQRRHYQQPQQQRGLRRQQHLRVGCPVGRPSDDVGTASVRC